MSAPTRRAVLGTIVAAPIATIPLAAAALPLPAMTPFDLAHAEYRRLRAIDDAFDRDHWAPMNEERKRRYAAVPTITVTFRDAIGVEHTLSTANMADVAMARFRATEAAAGRTRPADREYDRSCRRLLSGVRWRNRQFNVIGQQIGVEALDDHAEASASAVYEASWKVIEAPVDHVSQLAIKIEMIAESERWTCEDAIEAIRRDAVRLAGAA